MNTYSEQVNQTEIVIFCDEHGHPTGKTGPKLDSHHHDTQMHLAFSVYVFNRSGQLLVTKRAETKKVWPGVWTNSCCGHLATGETSIDAIKRRLQFELGMTAHTYVEILPTYTYKTPPYNGIIDHEFCPVYGALTDDQPVLNPNEVTDYRWLTWQEFVEQTAVDGDDYSDPSAEDAPKWSWWCKDQLKLLNQNEAFKQFLEKVAATS